MRKGSFVALNIVICVTFVCSGHRSHSTVSQDRQNLMKKRKAVTMWVRGKGGGEADHDLVQAGDGRHHLQRLLAPLPPLLPGQHVPPHHQQVQ